jgi:LysM repeat protein
MPLPSQTARAGSQTGRTNMYRRKQPKMGLVLAAGGVVVLGVAVWGLAKYLTPRHAEAEQAGLHPTSTEVQAPVTPAPLTLGAAPSAAGKLLATDNPAPRPADPPPVELRQGKFGGGEGGDPQAGREGQPSKPQLGHTPGVPANVGGTPTPGPGMSPGSGNSEPKAPAPSPATNPPPNPVTTAATPAPAAAGNLNISAPADLAPTIAAAKQKAAAGDLVASRVLYSQALRDERLSEVDRQSLRAELTRINDDLVFSAKATAGDPYVDTYVVQSGDRIIKIAQKLQLAPDYRLLKRINRLANDRDLKVGQKLKVIKAPFNAVVHKSEFRMDLYLGEGDNVDNWVYVRSFRVGLGEQGSTPVGTFRPKKGSKLVDPPWINPRTGEKFAGGDPKNPIGKFWVGLEGVGDAAQFNGYGIHGTIDPESIGQQKSMGCVRMAAEDIALVFELMGEQASVVKIVP